MKYIPETTLRPWLEALRSGKYIQGVSKLRNRDNTFCCLGVLCDINQDKSADIYWRVNPRAPYRGHMIAEGMHTELPQIMQKALGVEHGLMLVLMNLNDNGLNGAMRRSGAHTDEYAAWVRLAATWFDDHSRHLLITEEQRDYRWSFAMIADFLEWAHDPARRAPSNP